MQLQVIANYVTTTNNAHTAMNEDKEANKKNMSHSWMKAYPICFVTYMYG